MKLVFATHNLNKFEEVKALMPSSVELLSLNDIGCYDEIPETAETIEGNAIIKANFVKENYKLDCFADDTGLEVAVLNGEPGVHSARYAGKEKRTQDNIEKLLYNLKDKENRAAQFKTVVALNMEEHQHLFMGTCKGTITKERKGEKGFGYDPVFQPTSSNLTFAQMSLEEKSKISHRGIALRDLIDYLSQ